MLSPEQARQRLKAFKNPHYKLDQLFRLSFVGLKQAYIGQILIQAGPAWMVFGNTAHSEVLDLLVKMPAFHRKMLFWALFPRIYKQVEAAWNLFDILPYQTTYYRRPFRNPKHNNTPGARTNWLQHLLLATNGYDRDAAWFAAWAPYLGYGAADALGYLFAGAIEVGGKSGQEVFDVLVASANGRHKIGVMGRHVTRGLLCASRPDGWEAIERLLLAAQREEGLRQVILESIDEAHPQAFRRLLRLILDQNLIRFSAVVRAFGVWFGLALETAPQKTIPTLLKQILVYLDDPATGQEVIEAGSAQEAYYALWAMAFDDVLAALPHAITLRQSPDVERRFVATHFLAQIEFKGSFDEILNALDDPDLRIAARAVDGLQFFEYSQKLLEQSDLFERLERLMARLPHKENPLKPLVWDWFKLKLDRDDLAGRLMRYLDKRSPKRLIPYLPDMQPYYRSLVVRLLKKKGKRDPQTRQVLFSLVGDPSSSVRETVLEALRKFSLTNVEIEQMENLLSRQAEGLRQGIIQLLLGLSNKKLFHSIERLLTKKNEKQRKAGLELLRECTRAKRKTKTCRLIAVEYRKRPCLDENEIGLLEEILAEKIEKVSLKDALGLMNPRNLTRPRPPAAASFFRGFKKETLGSRAAVEILRSLDDQIEQHRTDAVELNHEEISRSELLGNIHSGFPLPNSSRLSEQELVNLPLREMWENWWESRPAALRDPDGFELCRALALLGLFQAEWIGYSRVVYKIPNKLQGTFNVRTNLKLNYLNIISPLLHWLIYLHPAGNEIPFLLNALEASAFRMAGVDCFYQEPFNGFFSQRIFPYLHICRWHRTMHPEDWQDKDHARLWAVVRWLDEPVMGFSRHHPEPEDVLWAWRAGAATRDDLLFLLLGSRKMDLYENPFTILGELTRHKPHPLFKTFPELKEVVDECRERILSIETRRGDLPTAATKPALALRSVPGMNNLFRFLLALEKENITRSTSSGQNRQEVFSSLIRVTCPTAEDTCERFAELVKNHRIPPRRLVELAVFAPQWATFVEDALQWPRLCEAVFWVYAHTKDRQWILNKEIYDLWSSQVSEYTPLSPDSLMDGAVDVAWFHQVYETLGEKRWQEVYRAAGLTAVGNGHTRARIFADAMLGKVTAGELIERITQKRHQDSLRALGLVPLPDGEDRQQEVLRRYEVIQEFLRTSKKFGSQRQASEKLALSVGIENLARSAGYADPQRLEWAMEVEAIADLANGPLVVEAGAVRLVLSIDDLGEPQLEVSKNGAPLKTIPAALKKDERIAGLVNRKRELERQARRMRVSLEQSMCRGDSFSGAEITGLFRHPILRAMLEQLIFIGPTGMGYPIEDGKALLTHSERRLTLTPGDALRFAHPVDLLESTEWHLWQHECFLHERIQPFKQVFRELYVLTPTEQGEGNLSRRYAGQQINPRQALALFGSRGWVTDPEAGVHKTFHDLGITARVGFLQAIFTPAEVEGLTLETVAFTRRGEWSPLALEKVNPRLFSEVMRDLDLVVSVAHAGGVDPEASASSIEARTALVQETCSLLKIPNVEVKNNHALVAGKLANYTIHLGSAVVHRQPGGSLCIVPVHAQQRGRLFLPFVDNDPKSAEVISKVILLAKDNEIRDPTILEQIL